VHNLATGDSSDQEQPETSASEHATPAADGHAGKDGVQNLLENEKAALRRSLEENEQEMKSIENAERQDERKLQYRRLSGANPASDTMEVAASHHDVDRDDDAEDADPSDQGDDPEVQKLERELRRQKREYQEARLSYEEREKRRDNHAEIEKERELEREISHYRYARHEIMHSMGPGGGDSRQLRDSEVSERRGNERREREEAERRERGRDHADNHNDDEHERDDDSVASVSDESRNKGHPHEQHRGPAAKHERESDYASIVGSIKSSLGDNVMRASDVGRSQSHHHHARALPGINTDSWWQQQPKLTEQQIKRKQAVEKAKEMAKPKECHDLYSCVGSFFTPSGKKGGGKSDVLHLDEQLHHKTKPEDLSVGSHIAGDNLVPKSDILNDPQKPLLSALMPSTSTHTSKLPGVAENRWGGTKFWARLLGTPIQKKHAEHRKQKKIILEH
jgi:hypothetical protein